MTAVRRLLVAAACASPGAAHHLYLYGSPQGQPVIWINVHR